MMSLDRFQLKLIAIFAMTIDHIAWLLVDIATWQGQFMHFIGRLTAPLMCLFLVEGYFLSKNITRYGLRLLIFALLSQLPFILMLYGWNKLVQQPILFFEKANILFNLLLGLLALLVWYSNFNKFSKTFIVIALLFFSTFMDWSIYVIIFTLIFAHFRENHNQQIIAYTITAMLMLILTDLGFISVMPVLVLNWFPVGILLVPFIWQFFNGEKGSQWGGRYFFYTYYPVHMLILAIIADSLQLRVL